MAREREPRVVFGFHAVLARLRADPKSVMEIFLDETRNDARGKDLAGAAERAGVRLMRVPTKRLDGFYGGGPPPWGAGRLGHETATPNPPSKTAHNEDTPLLSPPCGAAPPRPSPR